MLLVKLAAERDLARDSVLDLAQDPVVWAAMQQSTTELPAQNAAVADFKRCASVGCRLTGLAGSTRSR